MEIIAKYYVLTIYYKWLNMYDDILLTLYSAYNI